MKDFFIKLSFRLVGMIVYAFIVSLLADSSSRALVFALFGLGGILLYSFWKFDKWLADRRKAERRKAISDHVKKRQQAASADEIYYVEANNGMIVRIPSQKLDSWQQAQKNCSVELTDAEKKLRDRILQDIYGSRGSSNE